MLMLSSRGAVIARLTVCFPGADTTRISLKPDSALLDETEVWDAPATLRFNAPKRLSEIAQVNIGAP
jgi:hypothetical protein